MSHNVFLIQILALVILATVSFVLFRSVMAGKDEIENSGPSLSEIEKTLRKVLDTTTIKAAEPAPGPVIRDDDMPPPPVAVSGMTPEQLEAHKREVELLRNEVLSRESSLKELQKALEEARAAGANATSTTEFKALESKVKELQAKLGEYEIIEDDIANLSTYKTENNKLKMELESLRQRLGSQVEETGSISENVKQFSKLVGGGTPSSIPISGGDEATEEDSGEEVDEAVGEADELEASEEDTETEEGSEEMEASGEEADEEAEEYAEDETSDEESGEVEDSMEASSDEEKSSEEVATEGATTTAEGEQSAGVLDAAVDTDKLLTETKDLPETQSSIKEEGDPGQKLINEFEDFMKGS